MVEIRMARALAVEVRPPTGPRRSRLRAPHVRFARRQIPKLGLSDSMSAAKAPEGYYDASSMMPL